MKEQIKELIAENWEETVSLRHYLHQYPELAAEEAQTSAYLKKLVRQLGLPIIDVPADEMSGGYGFVAVLDTGRPGKTIALRTELDALPVQEAESNLTQSRKVISQNPGVMHACGHDGHMAILMTAMRILVRIKDQLNGRILFLFEEGEEISIGVHRMIELLADTSIDAFYGNHLLSHLPTGRLGITAGPAMAGLSVINFKVIGRGGHGSRPDLAVNPIFAGTAILNDLAIAWNNQLDVTKTVTLGITQFHSGETNNVIADEAHIGGTLRYFDSAEGEKATELVLRIAEQVAAVHGCTIEDLSHEDVDSLPVYNDPGLTHLAQQIAAELFPGQLLTDETWFASESFSEYQRLAPSIFAFVGTQNEAVGSGAAHHHEAFDMDDASMKQAIEMMVQFTIQFLKSIDEEESDD